MKRFFRNNGLSLAMFGAFFVLLFGHSIAGYFHYNEEQQDHNQPTISYGEYLRTGSFLESVGENWESEFLQMAAYVVLTAFLYQKGSAESNPLPDEETPSEPKDEPKPDSPWPVKKGGLILKLYEHSLAIAFIALFLISFGLHAVGGAAEYCTDQREHGQTACPSTVQYMGTSQFWFESLQNWQSEFLAVGSIVVLSIYLREKGSPESKPVNAPYNQTGGK
ncbi:MAG: hypothetical protein K8I30_05120 [Anaerolineae bacterium]|nr:hypothetical protein [Anaerolineae bacterium]